MQLRTMDQKRPSLFPPELPPRSPSRSNPLHKSAWQRWLAIALGLGLLTGAVVAGQWGYGQWQRDQRKEARSKIPTVTVEKADLPIVISANGSIQPERSINVSPKTSGILKELLVQEGQRVAAGVLLARMDDANLQGALLQATGQVASAQANLDRLIAGSRPEEIAQGSARLAAAQANAAKVRNGSRPEEIAQAQARLAAAEANAQKLRRGSRPQEIAQDEGRVQDAQANLVRAQQAFDRTQKLVAEGVLSRRDLDLAQTDLDSAQGKLKQSKQALNLNRSGSRSEDIAAAEAKVREAEDALGLLRSGSRSEDIAAAAAQVSEVREQLDVLRSGSRVEDIAQARAQLLSAQGNLRTIETQLNDTQLRAPFAGTITKKYADPGAYVTPNTASSTVSSATSSSILALASRNQVVANVAESDIAQIKVGLPVTIEVDAFVGQSFKGQISQIATQATLSQNVTSFEVKIAIEDPKQQLRTGMNSTVNIEAGKLTGVLTIPTVAIVRQDNQSGVYLAENKGAKDSESKKRKPGESAPKDDERSGSSAGERGGSGGSGKSKRSKSFHPIETGQTIGDRTVVTKGLKEGDRVLLGFPEGDRPKSRTPSMLPGLGGGGGSRGGGSGGGRGGS
jgi:HlyD family secretion protein